MDCPGIKYFPSLPMMKEIYGWDPQKEQQKLIPSPHLLQITQQMMALGATKFSRSSKTVKETYGSEYWGGI